MRFLFSDVRNDAALEAACDDDPSEYRMPLEQYLLAVTALVKVAEAARCHVEIVMRDGLVTGSDWDGFLDLQDALSLFDFEDDVR